MFNGLTFFIHQVLDSEKKGAAPFMPALQFQYKTKQRSAKNTSVSKT